MMAGCFLELKKYIQCFVPVKYSWRRYLANHLNLKGRAQFIIEWWIGFFWSSIEYFNSLMFQKQNIVTFHNYLCMLSFATKKPSKFVFRISFVVLISSLVVWSLVEWGWVEVGLLGLNLVEFGSVLFCWVELCWVKFDYAAFV